MFLCVQFFAKTREVESRIINHLFCRSQNRRVKKIAEAVQNKPLPPSAIDLPHSLS